MMALPIKIRSIGDNDFWCFGLQAASFAHIFAHKSEGHMNRPALELNRQKVAARLEREGWIARHGGMHDIYTHPDKPRRIITLPRHRTLSPGVARNTARTAGWI
jgi:mRNA interferase HicA